jgi:hypothetical protein
MTLDTTTHNIIDRDLAIEQRRVALTSTCPSGLAIAKSPFPFIRCCQIYPFDRYTVLKDVSCLQMTQTRFFFTWHPLEFPRTYHEEDYEDEGVGEQHLGYVPFIAPAEEMHNAAAINDDGGGHQVLVAAANEEPVPVPPQFGTLAQGGHATAIGIQEIVDAIDQGEEADEDEDDWEEEDEDGVEQVVHPQHLQALGLFQLKRECLCLLPILERADIIMAVY